MDIVPIEEFLRRTTGGRPNQMDVSIYAGCPLECACGNTHFFEPRAVRVLRELPAMSLVLQCPDGPFVTCIQIKGWFRYRFETLFGARDAADSLEPSPCPERIARSVFEAAQKAAEVTVAGFDDHNRPARSFLRIARAAPAPHRQLLVMVAAAYPLAEGAVVGQSTQSILDVEGDLYHRLGEAYGDSGPELFRDLQEFVQARFKPDQHDSTVKVCALVGTWLIWNLKGARPTDEELVSGSSEGFALWCLASQLYQKMIRASE